MFGEHMVVEEGLEVGRCRGEMDGEYGADPRYVHWWSCWGSF